MYWPSLCLQLLKVKSVSERKIFILQKTQLVKLYKNASVVNYLAYSYSDFISVDTTFIFIFYFNIVSVYKVKLINK